MIVNNLHRITH